MFASSAMSRTTVLANPWRATSRVAASTICARRRSTSPVSPTRATGRGALPADDFGRRSVGQAEAGGVSRMDDQGAARPSLDQHGQVVHPRVVRAELAAADE